MTIDIRESLADDLPAIEALYPAAFPEEDLLPLVRALLTDNPGVLSLVAVTGGGLAGHVAFTPCGVSESTAKVSLLAPLAVAPERQQQGIGSALVQEGFRLLKADATQRVFVLGDPAYYGRFGFAADALVAPPYPMPDEWRSAWQSRGLQDGAPEERGALTVPPVWRQPALWGP